MYMELRFAGFSHDEIVNMTVDQLVLFGRFARARYLESVAYQAMAYHPKPKVFVRNVLNLVKSLERGGTGIPYYDREKMKQIVRSIPGVVVEETKSGSGNGD